MVVASLVSRLSGKLLSSGSLGLGVEVLDLGLTEDAVNQLAAVQNLNLGVFM